MKGKMQSCRRYPIYMLYPSTPSIFCLLFYHIHRCATFLSFNFVLFFFFFHLFLCVLFFGFYFYFYNKFTGSPRPYGGPESAGSYAMMYNNMPHPGTTGTTSDYYSRNTTGKDVTTPHVHKKTQIYRIFIISQSNHFYAPDFFFLLFKCLSMCENVCVCVCGKIIAIQLLYFILEINCLVFKCVKHIVWVSSYFCLFVVG